MDGQKPEAVEEQSRTENPEDVAVLYSWANLQGARYRDFSGARRESRALMRHRAAQEAKDAESRAQAEAEAAAAATERAAREAEEIARLHEKAARRAAEARQRRDLELEEGARALALRQATELSRKAASERVQAARSAEAAAAAEAAERREAREITDARASAERQALRYAEAEMRRRRLAGPQPVSKLPGELTDPYQRESEQPAPEKVFATLITPEQDMRPARYPKTRDAHFHLPPTHANGEANEDDGILADPMTAAFAVTEAETAEVRNPGESPTVTAGVIESLIEMQPIAETSVQGGTQPASAERMRASAPVPAWLSEERPKPAVEPEAPVVEDTLQQSRERVASRWFALRELFEQGPQEKTPEVKKAASGEVPVLAVFSLAGGVGKTSLVATLGRALASSGEKVLLTDTTSHGLLPFYFGASELRPGVVRTFSPPVGSADAPIHLLSFDLLGKGGDLEAQEWLAEELTKNGQGMQRVLVDLSPSVPWVLRRVARMNSIVMVPMAPDMSSVISLNTVERFFAEVMDANGKPVHPRYVLNGFDASQPLHLDVREVLRQQLGDRLLPFVIRRSPAVSEALAEGMTVMDYAPEAAVAGDVLNLASWLKTQAAPAPGFRKARWSEQ